MTEGVTHKSSHEGLNRRPSTHGFILGKLDDEITRDMERFLKGQRTAANKSGPLSLRATGSPLTPPLLTQWELVSPTKRETLAPLRSVKGSVPQGNHVREKLMAFYEALQPEKHQLNFKNVEKHFDLLMHEDVQIHLSNQTFKKAEYRAVVADMVSRNVNCRDFIVRKCDADSAVYCITTVLNGVVTYSRLQATFLNGQCIKLEVALLSEGPNYSHQKQVLQRIYRALEPTLFSDRTPLLQNILQEALHPRFTAHFSTTAYTKGQWKAEWETLSTAGVAAIDLTLHYSEGDVCGFSVKLAVGATALTVHQKATFRDGRILQLDIVEPSAMLKLLAAARDPPQHDAMMPASPHAQDAISQQQQQHSLADKLNAALAGMSGRDELLKENDLKELFAALGVVVTDRRVQTMAKELRESLLTSKDLLPALKHTLQAMMKASLQTKQLEAINMDGMEDLKQHLAKHIVHNAEKPIRHVVLVIVVAEEIQPVLDHFQAQKDPAMEARMMGLATAFTCTVGQPHTSTSYRLTILQVAQSAIYKRHYSGYTQAAAIATLVARDLECDLMISFGTAGGMDGNVAIGDTVLCTGCVYIDRIRTNSKQSHDWGAYGGPVIPCPNMKRDLNLKEGIVGSHISYIVGDVQMQMADLIGVVTMDMEAAPEAEVCHQVGMNFMALKVVSDRITDEDGTNEEEYQRNKARVSAVAVKVLTAVLEYLRGKRPCDL
eukprot:GGOE01022044.1.p1 GENE.GGOE01022044.1~~GGOE01022044.1.p1  ORF type:complete len:735 (+),score=210.91 GGOE01022044.1:53-2206(+)